MACIKKSVSQMELKTKIIEFTNIIDSNEVAYNDLSHLDQFKYCISLVIRHFLSFQNTPKNLDLSYKTDLDLWDCIGRAKLIL